MATGQMEVPADLDWAQLSWLVCLQADGRSTGDKLLQDDLGLDPAVLLMFPHLPSQPGFISWWRWGSEGELSGHVLKEEGRGTREGTETCQGFCKSLLLLSPLTFYQPRRVMWPCPDLGWRG